MIRKAAGQFLELLPRSSRRFGPQQNAEIAAKSLREKAELALRIAVPFLRRGNRLRHKESHPPFGPLLKFPRMFSVVREHPQCWSRIRSLDELKRRIVVVVLTGVDHFTQGGFDSLWARFHDSFD